MKKLLTFSLIILFVFGSTISFAQDISTVEYEELINEIICEFTDFALKNQNNQPHYSKFKSDVGTCDYYTTMEFLKGRNNLPKNTREIVNIIFYDYYKERYNESSTNQEKYEVLMGLFEEDELSEFAKNYGSSYSGFETDLKGTIKERLRVDEYADEVVPEEVIEANDAEFDSLTNLSTNDEPIDSPDDYLTDDNNDVESSNELGSSLLLFGFLALLLAYGGYLWYQRSKTNTSTGQSLPAKSSKKSFWERITGQPSKKDVYQDKIDELQALIQKHKTTLAAIRLDIDEMHQKVNQLALLADKEEQVEEHLKELSEKLDEVESKQKDLLIILDDIENEPEPEDTDDETANLKIENESTTIEEIVDEIPVVPPTIKLNTPPDLFFMPAPNADGSFSYKDWNVKFVSDKSFYRFEMLNNVEAKFVFHDDKENIAKAIANPDVYLNPVCKILNIDFKEPKTIVIQKQNSGIVYKDGDTWRLKEKAVVYYN